MEFKFKNELLLIDFLTILLILVISFFPVKALRLVLGLPFILFFPGYTLIAALFPRKTDLDSIERVALSFGLSIAIVPLIGLILNYTPWGIRLYPILLSLSGFILITSAFAWQRRRRLLPAERPELELHLSSGWWGGRSALDKALSLVLILAILGALGTLGWVIAKPKVGERFTEFYILGPGGKAEDYPRKLKLGQEGKVILGIINREHQQMGYRVELLINGEKIKEIGPVTLNHDQKWEKVISFRPRKEGRNQKVEFLLYKIRHLGRARDTLLRLRLEKEFLTEGKHRRVRKGFKARIKNLGGPVSFEIRLGKGTPRLGPIRLKGGEEWNKEYYFEVMEDTTNEFQLLRDGKIIYREKIEQYPSLHLWVDVEGAGGRAK